MKDATSDSVPAHLVREKLERIERSGPMRQSNQLRALLRHLTGHTSSKDCTPEQQRQVRDHLQGLAERMGVASPQRRAGFEARYQAASPRERKVWAIWLDMARRGLVHNKSAQALDAFVQRQTGVSALRWCSAAQLDAVIEALKLWQKRGVEVR